MYYDKLLGLCDYEPEEIERERQRLERAFALLQLTPEDFTRAEESSSSDRNPGTASTFTKPRSG